MKICSICKDPKEGTEFPKKSSSKDGLTSACKICTNENNRKSYKKRDKGKSKLRNKKKIKVARQYCYNYLLSHTCITCKESDPIVLEFNHIDPTTKVNSISSMVQKGASPKALEEEISKCNIMCANCHRRHTAYQFGYYTTRFDSL